MIILANVGSKALYFLFLWLASATAAAWMADRKGYTERVGLTFGLILSFVGLIIVCILPGRPGSAWKVEGPLPFGRNRRGTGAVLGPLPAPPAEGELGPPLDLDVDPPPDQS